MATVRTVRRGRRTYHYLSQAYRWNGRSLKRHVYLGTVPPKDLDSARVALDREVRAATWFVEFDRIRDGFNRRYARLTPTAAARERQDFVEEFTFDTHRIDGSRLTFRETENLLETGTTPADRRLQDVKESEAHARLLERLLETPEPVDLTHLLSWHRELYAGTRPELAGRLRRSEIRVPNSRFAPPRSADVRPMLVTLVRDVRASVPAVHPVERAAVFHVRFEQIHPFEDGNGPLGRLAMNLLLHQSGYPMLNIRFSKRRSYFHALERANETGNLRPFVLWFCRRYARALHWCRL